MTDVDAYLERLGYEGPTDPSLDTLQALQYAHLVAVPFENLDVVGGVAVSTDVDVTLAKLVNGRGGWCFENNGAFAWLLEQLGFRVRRLGAAVLLQGAAVLVDHLTLEHPHLGRQSRGNETDREDPEQRERAGGHEFSVQFGRDFSS